MVGGSLSRGELGHELQLNCGRREFTALPQCSLQLLSDAQGEQLAIQGYEAANPKNEPLKPKTSTLSRSDLIKFE
jgi:hypothetical protein